MKNQSHIRVLLLAGEEEGKFARKIFAGIMPKRYALEWVKTHEKALEALLRFEPELILMELSSSAEKGEVVWRKTEIVNLPAPVILLTDKTAAEARKEAVACGAADFLPKGGYDAAVLDRSIRYAISRRQQREELALVKKAVDSAERVQKELMAVLDYEVRIPLNTIMGNVDLLRNVSLLEEQKAEVLEDIHQGADDLLKVIEGIVNLSEAEFSQLEIEYEPFPLRLGLKEMVGEFAPTAEGKGLALKLHFRDESPELVIGDIHRLRQVLVIVVGNAVKFTRSGSISITVGAKKIAGKGASAPGKEESKHWELEFEVRDTGIGLRAEQIEQLFEPFSGDHSSGGLAFGGTGLSLAIAKRLCEFMGGRIWVEKSEPGKGSIFRFTLLAGLGDEILKELQGLPGKKKRALAAPFSDIALNILVAEDNPINRTLLQSWLASLGFQADFAKDGLEVLEAVKRKPYDLIFMDIMMPKLDGYGATRRIRLLEKYEPGVEIRAARPCYIVALTVLARPKDQARCLKAGMDDYLAKPVQFAQVRSMVESVARRKASAEGESSG